MLTGGCNQSLLKYPQGDLVMLIRPDVLYFHIDGLGSSLVKLVLQYLLLIK